MAIAAWNKNGLFIAKQGRQIEEGGTALAFSPDYSGQRIISSGVVAFQDWDNTTAWPTAYRRAEVLFPYPVSKPPICYFVGGYAGSAWKMLPVFQEMRTESAGGGTYRNVQAPLLFCWCTLDRLFMYSRFDKTFINTASYVITENTAE